MPTLVWNSTENSLSQGGPGLSHTRVPFVAGTVPVCPEHRPAQNVYMFVGFVCPKKNKHTLMHTKTDKAAQKMRSNLYREGGIFEKSSLIIGHLDEEKSHPI